MLAPKLVRLAFVMLAVFSLGNVHSALAGDGVGAGGGGDSKPIDDGAAWFLGAGKKVHICFERAANFPAVDAEATLSAAFATWKNYVGARPGDFKAPFTLALDPEFLSRCDGTEDLKIYLGVEDAQVKAARAQFNSPAAFAQRTSYSLKQGWGKGFIWIASKSTAVDWTKPYALLGIMLHELGHVLGCGHIEGTIMTESIIALVQATYASEAEAKVKLGNIDNRIQLSTCSACIHGKIRGKISDGSDGSARSVFKLFTGREAVGRIRAELPVPSALKKLPKPSEIYFDLVFSDAKGSVRLPLHFSVASTSAAGSIAAFRMALATEVAPDGTILSARGGGVIPTSQTYFGKVRDANGVSHDFVWEQNNHDPVHIKFYTGYEVQTLFLADPYGLQQ